MPRLNCSRISWNSRCSSSSCGSRRSIRIRVSRGAGLLEDHRAEIHEARIRAPACRRRRRGGAGGRRRRAARRRTRGGRGRRPAAPGRSPGGRRARSAPRWRPRRAAFAGIVLLDPAVHGERLVGRRPPGRARRPARGRPRAAAPARRSGTPAPPASGGGGSRPARARPAGRRSPAAPVQSSARS